jgi:cell division protease FtsH
MRGTLRSLPVLAALIALAAPSGASAAAAGGSASCTIPFEIAHTQQLGEASLSSGPYKLTVLDTSQLNCGDASNEVRDALRAPGAELPSGWRYDVASRVLSRDDATDAVRVEAAPDDILGGAGGGGKSMWDAMESFALTWLPIIFMGLIAAAVVWMVRYMPRTKPTEIAPSSSSSVRWDDVAGVEEAKDELREVVEFMRDPKRFKKLGAKVPKGILLHGPPGTGNRRLFRHARKAAPAIVFIDELDAVGATRGNDISGEKDQTLNQLLVELDGFGSADNVVVIAASNLLEKLDPALLRPGRFDRQILVTPPDLKGRRSILNVHTRGKPLATDVDIEMIARQTSGMTGADLANICNEAAIFAGRAHRDELRTKDFQAALERVVAGMQSRRVITEHEKEVVAYHEAGHALCSELLESVEKVHRISIIPRGKALGYTLNLPEEDRYLKTKEELLDYMVVLLGGRVTEHLVFGEITTGASDDLRKVHDISRSMVTEYGMGTELMSKQVPTDDYSMSDSTRRQVDEEQQYQTDLAHRRAMRIVNENRPLLDTLAHTLLENEVLEREDIERLVGEYRDGGGGGDSNGHRRRVVPVAEPGKARVAAAKPLRGQPGGDSPS